MNARAVAQIALIEAQTAALIGDDLYMLTTLLSALNFIASNGTMYASRWHHCRRIIDADAAPAIPPAPHDKGPQ
jgi:hypothetical protein